MIEKLGGRKFVLTLLIIAVATVIELLTERGITEAYAMLLAGLVGVYSASNVAITRGALTAAGVTSEEGGEEALTPPEAPGAPELAALSERLQAQEEALASVAESVAQSNQLMLQVLQPQPPAGLSAQAAANRAILNQPR